MKHLPEAWFLAAIAARTAIVLVALVGGARLFGKRDVGELHLVDVAMVLLLGNAVQNAITTGSGQLWVGLVSAGVLLLMDRALGIMVVAEPWLERKLAGEPTVIVVHGRMDRAAMRRENVDEEEVLAAARHQGLPDLSRVRLAVLEDDGSISVVPEDDDEL